MRPSQAEVFLAVLEEGSIADAARRLHRSRTTLSALLASLEDELNARLFERSGKSITPTDLAWAIQPDAIRLLQAYHQIVRRCELERGGIETTLRLARDDSLPEAFWLEAMRTLKDRFPMTGISVYLAPPQELPTLVANQTVDIAFGLNLTKVIDPNVYLEPLAGLRLMMISSTNHPLARLPEIQRDDLIAHTQITLAFVDHEEELVPDVILSTNYLALTQYELIRDAVEANAGWAWLPQPLVSSESIGTQYKVLKTAEGLLWKDFCGFHFSSNTKGKVALKLEEILVSYLSQFH